jgi:hypothetical protein
VQRRALTPEPGEHRARTEFDVVGVRGEGKDAGEGKTASTHSESPPPVYHAPMTAVVFLGENDWAAHCNEAARAINSVAGPGTARCWTLNGCGTHHLLDHASQFGHDALYAIRGDARWAVAIDSNGHETFRSMMSRLGLRLHHEPNASALRDGLPPIHFPVHIAASHCGSGYRWNRQELDDSDVANGFSLRFVSPDSIRAAAPLLTYPMRNARPEEEMQRLGLRCVTPDGLPPVPRRGAKYIVRVGHSPQDCRRKGTDEIKAGVAAVQVNPPEDVEVEFDVMTALPRGEVLRRKAACHVFIDQMVSDVGGYGQSAIEAMAFGCATLADVRNVPLDYIARFFPPPPILDTRNANVVERRLRWLCENAQDGLPHLQEFRRQTAAWSEVGSSYAAVGRYWLDAFAAAGGPIPTGPGEDRT